jgi:hypothetical protein
MKSGHCANVEAAKLRPLFACRHVHAGDFRQVLVSGDAGLFCPYVADLKCDQQRHEYADEWSSGHVGSPG